MAGTCEGRRKQPWLVRYRVGQQRSRVRRPEPGNKSTTSKTGCNGGRVGGIAKVWFPPSAKRRCAEGPGKDDRGIATGQETGADAEHSARDWPRCSLSIVGALLGGCVLVAFALLCVVHVVRATCMSVVVERELVDPDNPLSFCSLFPSFGVTPPPRAPLFRRSTVFCLLARPFGACRPLPAEGPSNVFCPVVQGGGAKASSPHPQQRPHHDDRAVDESVRWPPERSRFRPALWGADRVLGTVIGLFGGFDAMSRRLADVLRGPLVPVVVGMGAAALDTPPSPLAHRCTAPLSPRPPRTQGRGKSPGLFSSVSRDQTTGGLLLARAEAL